ncbi:MAG: GGDEF domain-containing protein [Planctomycetes bacterium]|nr:GGDEF domain-containing protein [Planctomycetota bacterium]
MPPFQDIRPRDSGRGLFTPAETEQLMRVEFERSQRHGMPLVCLLIGVDRLSTLQDLYGRDAREEILIATIGSLRRITREHDLLCALSDDRIVALFPHAAPALGALLARKLLEAARDMRFEREGRSLRITLSIGVAHNRHKEAITFDTLVAVAEEGLVVADSAGGDRFVETELYQLVEQQRRARELEAQRARQSGAAPASAPAQASVVPGAPPVRAPKLGDTLLDVLSGMGVRVDDPDSLDKDSLTRLLFRLQDERAPIANTELADERRKNDVLERRIAKLVSQLGITESELKRIAQLKNIDLGIASIYRDIQGLGGQDSQGERKREMMAEIFAANFQMKREIEARNGPKA